MNRKRFEVYMMFTRIPFIKHISKELEHYSNEDESLIGTIIHDLIDNDYVYIVLARDEVNHFRCIEVEASIESIIEARDRLHGRIRWLTQQNVKTVNQNGTKEGLNLFVDQLPENQQHFYYQVLKNSESHLAAKELFIEVEKFYDDVDGNFIEQFQSINGFDARLWELYLFCYLTEEGFEILRTHSRPDFLISKDESKVAIEAVIVARKDDKKSTIGAFKHKTIEEARELNKNEMPLRFSSALDQKLKKKYWTLPHIQGKPLIIAIADFHDEFSMTWSFNALLELLYGFKHNFYHEKDGQLIINPLKVEAYLKGNGTKIPSGFFSWPDSEHISGVLFSSTATLAKFNRIGKQAGFGNDNCVLVRYGGRHDPDPNASMPLPFAYKVDVHSNETWSEGTSIYHNPNALIPIDKSLFPSTAHHYFDNGQIISDVPEFHPYFSITENHFVSKSKK